MNNSTSCHICDSEAFHALDKDGYNLFECRKCKLIFVNPMPTDKELNELYSSVTGYQKNKTIAKKINKEQFDSYSKIINYINSKVTCDGPRLLDIGCSSGDFLVMAKELGFAVEGIELNETTAGVARSRGLVVHSGRIGDISLLPKSFDVVHLGDVIEHVQNPRGLIEEIVHLLKPNGMLIITTPNMRCFWAESTRKLYDYFSIPWSVATPPHHLFQFSDYNLDLLMNKFNLKVSARWYNHLPNLIYELGSLHLLQVWKKKRSALSGLRLFFGFASYTFIFVLNKISKPIRSRDMGMVSIYSRE